MQYSSACLPQAMLLSVPCLLPFTRTTPRRHGREDRITRHEEAVDLWVFLSNILDIAAFYGYLVENY